MTRETASTIACSVWLSRSASRGLAKTQVGQTGHTDQTPKPHSNGVLLPHEPAGQISHEKDNAGQRCNSPRGVAGDTQFEQPGNEPDQDEERRDCRHENIGRSGAETRAGPQIDAFVMEGLVLRGRSPVTERHGTLVVSL